MHTQPRRGNSSNSYLQLVAPANMWGIYFLKMARICECLRNTIHFVFFFISKGHISSYYGMKFYFTSFENVASDNGMRAPLTAESCHRVHAHS
jgi:hypothetical protein